MNNLRVTVVIAVTAVWVLTFIATVFVNAELQTLATLATPVELLVVGWLGAGEVLDRRNGPSGPHQPRPIPLQEDTPA